MKKLVFAISIAFIVLITISCKQNPSEKANSKASPQTGAQTIYATLNGIDAVKAATMMGYFNGIKGMDKSPTQTSIWFDSNTVNQIVQLLDSEGADGIRIYYVSDTSVHVAPFKNSIILVSTKSSGADVSVPSGALHVDYYQHDGSNVLFGTLSAINGEVCYKNTCPGALLYTACGPKCPGNSPCRPDNKHYIPRAVAEQMVASFGTHPVNTVSEWFEIGMFEAFARDKNYDGIRIYFATRLKQAGLEYSERDGFVITTTVAGSNGSHVDDFECKTSNAFLNGYKSNHQYFVNKKIVAPFTDNGQDNGELCPTHCNPTK
jgi:uncharacterized protein YraI